MKTQKFPYVYGLGLSICALHQRKALAHLQASRQLGVTQKTAWFVLHRVREMLRVKAPHMLKDTVQIDETYVVALKRTNTQTSAPR